MGLINQCVLSSQPCVVDGMVTNGTVAEGKAPPTTEMEIRNGKGKTQHGVDLVFRDVTVNVGENEILHDVSGVVQRGQMLALMGPSGAGKSTLLNTLAGRLPLHSGDITLNNQPLNKQMRRKICYVLQEDVFFSNLTLRQTLTFSAMLRLPDKMKWSEKLKRVEEIVDTLDLRKCLDTIMGDMFNPGLSGGEKKRANIACELLTNPMLMLLDEPTSGLDSAIACNMMTTLKTYTQTSNKTVVTTIHQPSSAIFHMFDWVLLLTNGHVAYFGPGEQIMTFFSDLGLACTPHYNPADFILEKVKESKETAALVISAAYKRRRTQKWPSELRSEKWPLDDQTPVVYTTDIATRNSETCNGHIIRTDADMVTIDLGSSDVLEDELDKMYDPNRKWPTGFWTQYTTLTHRNLVQSRNRILSKLNLVQTFLLALICGMLWFQLPRTEKILNDRLGLIFFCNLYWAMFAMFDAVITFPAERPVIKKERPSGAYRVSAYYCAKMTSELPLTLLQPLVFFSIIYWTCNLNSDPLTFFASLGSLLLTTIASQSFSLFVGTVTPNVSTGIMVGTIFLLGSMLAGGFYRQYVAPYFVWLSYISFIHYAYHMLVVLELLHGDPIRCLPANVSAFPECTSPSSSNETLYITGETILKARNVNTNLWLYLSVLTGFIVFFRFSGYLALRFYDPMKNHMPKLCSKVKKSSTEKPSNNQVSPAYPELSFKDGPKSSSPGTECVINTQRCITYL